MNCMGFRRALSVRPASQDPEALAHRRECAACDAFARRQADFERSLVEAARIPVPEGLASRVLVAHGVALEGSRRVRQSRFQAALAAVATLGVIASWLGLRPEPLARAVLGHIDAEPSHLSDRRDLSREQVNAVLAPLAIVVEAGLGRVDYAGTCTIRKRLGAHLVLPGSRGPVTVLFMPDERVPDRMPVVDARRLGIIVPASRGSIAIVGEPGEKLEEIERRLRLTTRFASMRSPSGGGARVHLGEVDGGGYA